MTGYSGTLTEAQTVRIEQVVDWWMTVALSTERCDRPAAEAAVRTVYAAFGLDRPQVVWRDSPKAGLEVLAELDDRLYTQLGTRLYAHLYAQLDARLEAQLYDQVADRLYTQLHTRFYDRLEAQLHVRLRAGLDIRLRTLLYGRLGPWLDGYWLAFHTLAREIVVLPPSPRLDTLAAAVAHLGWWWPLRDTVVLTDRPIEIHRDPLGRLHKLDGPALVYPDGFCGSWRHGVAVPDDMRTEALLDTTEAGPSRPAAAGNGRS